MLSQQRVNELLEIYENLKKRILLVDEKYSLDYHDPVIDLPESLGLEKMVFQDKTQEEIAAIVEKKYAPIYHTKNNAIIAWYDSHIRAVSLKRDKLAEKQRLGEKKLKDDFDKAYADMYAKIARNGLLFSTVREKKMAETKANYDNRLAEYQKDIQGEVDLLNKEEIMYNKLFQQRNVNLTAYQISLEKLYTAQVTEELRKEKERVEKYNQQVDEKEARYKVTLERLKETARKNEYDRLYKMTKLYAEIGETGIKSRRIAEKTEVCKQYFLPLTKEEGQFMLSLDSFLRNHLDTYYNTFVTWVNNTLK